MINAVRGNVSAEPLIRVVISIVVNVATGCVPADYSTLGSPALVLAGKRNVMLKWTNERFQSG